MLGHSQTEKVPKKALWYTISKFPISGTNSAWTYLFGKVLQGENVYLAIKSMQVSVSST